MIEASFAFLRKELLLSAAMAALISTSILIGRLPAISMVEIEVVFLLWVLFIDVKGFEYSGMPGNVARRIERGRFIAPKLVMITFIMSALITNDVALVVMIPLTLAMRSENKGGLVMLQAFAANAGSAITPFGNPQNLYLYWLYKITPIRFIETMLPFSIFFLGILLFGAFCYGSKYQQEGHPDEKGLPVSRNSAMAYGIFFILTVFSILRLLPLEVNFLILGCVLFTDRKALKVDYVLLATFLVFFGLTENIKVMLSSVLEHPGHIFVLSALISQVASNVPTAILMSKFTTQWRALLWGTNVGGFGSLIASFANLIAYRLYVTSEDSKANNGKNIVRFTSTFVGLGYLLLIIGVMLYMNL